MAGTLFVVATPIGNLEDLSFRALRTLKEVDLIAAEDTRRTAKLLAHYAIRKSLVSLREHNERRETPRLVARLTAGESIALVSDAGTPGISDPGQHLVRAAREAGIKVSPIPGPSAVMAALSASGVESNQFLFLGFPPRSGSDRTKWMDEAAAATRVVVFFEAPHRITRTINELTMLLVNRPIYIHREISKINEEFVKYTNNGSTSDVRPIGEFAVIVDKAADGAVSPADADAKLGQAVRMLLCLTNNCLFDIAEAEKLVSAALSLDSRAVRKAAKRQRIEQKRREDAVS